MTTINAVGSGLSGSTGTGSFVGSTSPSITTGLNDTNGNTWIKQTATASAVNGVNITNTATGNPPVVNATGTDTNITLQLQGKGTGGASPKGTSTNDNASAGYVGELVSAQVAFASAVSFSNGVSRDITTISLSAGDWDIWGNIFVTYSNTSTGTAGWISTTSATAPDQSLIAGPYQLTAGSIADFGYAVLPVRLTLSTTTTVYLSAFSNFTLGTSTGCGAIYARRRR